MHAWKKARLGKEWRERKRTKEERREGGRGSMRERGGEAVR
jgi:hypothetical protein